MRIFSDWERLFLDLLFYHIYLRCFVVIEIKTVEFIPEYALRDINKPIGVSEYKLLQSMPDELKPSFPTVEQLEKELLKIRKDP